MKNSMMLLISLCFFVSCAESPEISHNKEGVMFVSPQGWKISDESNLENQGYYLSLEKDGFSSSGLFSITWINNFLENEEYMDIFKNEMSNNFIYKNSNLVFGDVYENDFNGNSCLSVNFSANILSVEHEGIIYIFSDKGKTFALLRQEATEDKQKNAEGFENIEKSFKIE